jgi:hypothetical protein
MQSKFLNVGLFITKVINEMGFKKKSCQGYENQIFDSMKRSWNINTFFIQFFFFLRSYNFKMEKKAYSCMKQVWVHFTKIVSNVFTLFILIFFFSKN